MNTNGSDRKSYTYLIGWSKLKLYYYGVRFAKGCHPDEFWISYHTSSRSVHECIEMHGSPDIVTIRRIFTNIETARKWETKVLKRLKVVLRTDFLNKTDNISIAPMCGDNNPAKRPEVKAKIAASVSKYYEDKPGTNAGKTWSDEKTREWGDARKGSNNPFYGHTHSVENRRLISERQQGEKNSFYGKRHSVSLKKMVSKQFKGIPKSRVCCIHCHKDVTVNTFPMYHGDNCKNKK